MTNKTLKVGQYGADVAQIVPATPGWYAKYKDLGDYHYEPIAYFFVVMLPEGGTYTDAPILGEVQEFLATEVDGFEGFVYSPNKVLSAEESNDD